MTLTFPLIQDTAERAPYNPADLSDQAVHCLVTIAPGVSVKAYADGDNVWVEGTAVTFNVGWGRGNTEVAPFIEVRVIGNAAERILEQSWTLGDIYSWNPRRQNGSRPIGSGTSDHRKESVPFAFLPIEITVIATGLKQEGVLAFKRPESAAIVDASVPEADPGKRTVSCSVDFFGYSWIWESDLNWSTVGNMLEHGRCIQGADRLWERFLALNAPESVRVDRKGSSAIEKRKDIAPNLARLAKDSPVDFLFLEWLHDGQVTQKTSNNKLLTAFLETVGTSYDHLLKAVRLARSTAHVQTEELMYPGKSYARVERHLLSQRGMCERLPGAAESLQATQAKSDWTKREGNTGKAEGLGIDQAKYPLLYEEVVSGRISTFLFQQPGGEAVNLEFPIWEKALARKGWPEVIRDICANVSGRKTYERDLTPYLSFLFRIEAYLDKHAPAAKKGKGWRAIPRFVQSTAELELNDDAKEGTVKKRSAFTPVADNEARTITVPYVAVAVSGAYTTWCYSRHYHVFQEGMTDPESEGIVVSDLEEKLNGRDDYGLMFFTLTGSATSRGYPTFLVIFERRPTSGSTFVHFHRVHPNRSKDGKKTPACHLVQECYRYMAGNIRAEDIVAQQGDLIFLHVREGIGAKGVKEPRPISEFESHRFEQGSGEAVTLYESTAKEPKNRLGFLVAPTGMAVRHPEHEDIEFLPEGTYEVRRCKSYENNPVAVWSFNHD